MGAGKLVLTVCTFKWRGSPLAFSRYTAAHVHRLRDMFRRHLRLKHEFVCITDDPTGLDTDVRVVPLWSDHSLIPNPHGPRQPSCYRRLKLFSAAMRDQVGERVLWCDLDMVLTGDVTPLFDRPEPVVLLPTESHNIPVNGSLVLLTPGSHDEVWTDFDPQTSPKLAQAAGCYGSDQGWLAYCLKDKAAMWKPGSGGDGIYFYGQHLRRMGQQKNLPSDARLVSFHGRAAPWGHAESAIPWVRQHYGVM